MTFGALEGYNAETSAQTLCTAIVRGDFGGWVSRRSYFHRLSQVGPASRLGRLDPALRECCCRWREGRRLL